MLRLAECLHDRELNAMFESWVTYSTDMSATIEEAMMARRRRISFHLGKPLLRRIRSLNLAWPCYETCSRVSVNELSMRKMMESSGTPREGIGTISRAVFAR